MVKIIDSYRDVEYPYLSLLGDRSYYPIKLSKQCNIGKDVYMRNRWWYAGWCPLGFERSIVYG